LPDGRKLAAVVHVEAILEGEEDDVLLQRDDVIFVGGGDE
jgi:hypothetical protein